MNRRLTRLGVLTMASLGAIGLAAPHAEACSCAPLQIDAAFKRSDAAIIGKLLDVRRVGENRSRGVGPIGFSRRADFIYRVRRVYKGESRIDQDRRLSVRSSGNEAVCGLPRQRDRIGLFLDRGRKRWRSNLCLTVSARSMRRAGEGRDPGPSSGGCGPAQAAG